MENGYVLGKLEIQDLISMLTPNEVQAAQEKLKIFVKEYSVIGPERLAVLAYLIGEKNGVYASTNLQEEAFAEHLHQIYNMGKRHGFTEATILFGGQKPQNPFGHQGGGSRA